MKNFCFWALFFFLIVLILGSAVAQVQRYEIQSDGVYFPPKEKGEEKIFSITPYTYSLRIGGGYSFSLLEFNFDKKGIMDGVPAEVLSDDVDWGFTYPNFAGNLEIKLGLPDPLEKFAVGFAFDYNVLPIDKMKFTAEGIVVKSGKEDDVSDVHTLSIVAFLEFRVPIQVGQSWLAPYARFGVGLNININTNRDLIKIDGTSLALMASIGMEYYVTRDISIFLEPRWHYNEPGLSFRPFSKNTEFTGTVDLSNLTFLIGINFYFGMGKNL